MKKSNKVKIIRRLGRLTALTTKRRGILRRLSPGEHGKRRERFFKVTYVSDNFKMALLEKQRLRFNFKLKDKQLQNYYNLSKSLKGNIVVNVLYILESRLDYLVYRFAFTNTLSFARQLINHRYIFVNKKKKSLPGLICAPGNIISVSKKSKKLYKGILKIFFTRVKQNFIWKTKMRKLSQGWLRYSRFLPKHLKFILFPMQGVYAKNIKRKNFSIKIDERKVMEHYS
jgi:small subunit ribosomal protein S4